MKIVIPTIQHTGTKLVARMFGDINYCSLSEDCDGEAIFVGHISEGRLDDIHRLLEKYPAIIPLRHPYLIYESWLRRGKSIATLIANYRLLVNKLSIYDNHYISIDKSSKIEQLESINKDLGLNLKTDWKPVNVVSHTHDLLPEDIDPPQSIIDLVDESQEFLSKFY